MEKIQVILLGAGCRGTAYTDIMATLPEQFQVVGMADPLKDHQHYISEKHGVPMERCYDSWEDILNVPKFADVAIIFHTGQYALCPGNESTGAGL